VHSSLQAVSACGRSCRKVIEGRGLSVRRVPVSVACLRPLEPTELIELVELVEPGPQPNAELCEGN
jgi:hypothetical protein